MKIILTLISMLFSIAHTFAQTNYYTSTKIFNENSYTYQCDVAGSGTIRLYNKTNKWTYSPQMDTTIGEPYMHPDVYVPLFEDDNWTRSKRFDIVNSAFSTTEKKRIKEELIISMYIDPKTGKVSEVDFIFHTFDSLATIPVSVYRKIETELKSNIWYTPTELGRKMNYILYWWDQKPK